MNKPWSFTRDKKCIHSSNESSHHARRGAMSKLSPPMQGDFDATPPASRKFEALAEFDKAKHAIWKITQLGIADKEEIGIYQAFLALIGIRATAQAQKLLIIEDKAAHKGEKSWKNM